MKAPANLVKAVERLNPQFILLLDTNTIMDYPQFVSDEIATPGPFLLVVPQVVDNELLSLTFNLDQGTKQKASRARKQLGRLYERGNAKDGIDVGNYRWIVTVSAPRLEPDGASLEDDQIWRYLGQVDAALLRLADACTEDVDDTHTMLVTKDKNLTHVSRLRGLAVCSWPELQSSGTLDKLLLPDDRSGPVPDIDTYFSSLLNPNEKRSVKIAMTLEELRSEGDYLIARGIGRLTYEGEEYHFRWMYPYKDAEKVKDLDSLLDMIGNTGGIPVESLDFMGENVEPIPEEVRRFACSVLESASWAHVWDQAKIGALGRTARAVMDVNLGFGFGWWDGSYSLQSPLSRARLAFSYMEAVHWGYYCGGGRLPWTWQSDGKDIDDDIKDLYYDYFNRCEDLMNLTAYDLDTFTSLYRDAFEMYKELVDKVGKLEFTTEGRFTLAQETDIKLSWDRVPGEPVGDPEPGLRWLLKVALDSWPIGHTREEQFSYNPFA